MGKTRGLFKKIGAEKNRNFKQEKKRKIKRLGRGEIFSRVRRKRTGFAFCCIDYITEAWTQMTENLAKWLSPPWRASGQVQWMQMARSQNRLDITLGSDFCFSGAMGRLSWEIRRPQIQPRPWHPHGQACAGSPASTQPSLQPLLRPSRPCSQLSY